MSYSGRQVSESSGEFVKIAENDYKVQVKFVDRAKLHCSVLVKGCENEADKVRNAARYLCFHMCGSVSFCKIECYLIYSLASQRILFLISESNPSKFAVKNIPTSSRNRERK